jgi:L,D-transpeptidase ErfK/SrfK
LFPLFLVPVQAATFDLPEDGDIIGEIRSVTVEHEDTLADIARRYDIGYDQITRANPGVNPWVPGEGTRIVLPTQFILPDAPREGIVLNLPEMRLYYYPKAEPGERRQVITYPLGIGREGWNTPLGKTQVVRKEANPSWYPPESIRKEHAAEGDMLPEVVPPGPDNPLGQFALYLGIKGYLIHGTDKPYGIGMRVSHGCVRLYPEDIASLFTKVPVGTPVHIIDQPFKVSWHNGQIYLEAHPPLVEAEEAEDKPHNTPLTPLVQAVLAKTGETEGLVEWDKALAVAGDPRGIPVSITASAGREASAAAPAAPATPVLATLERPVQVQESIVSEQANGMSQTSSSSPLSMDSPKTPLEAAGISTPLTQDGSPEGPWFVQVGAFRRPDNAERLAERLQSLAPPVPALHSAQDGLYRVIAGPFLDRAEADQAARRITASLQIETRVLPPSAQ